MTPRPRLLAIMGSGETAPTMARVHRLLVERLGPAPVDAVLLDSPYGFQENADEVSARAVGYFRNFQIPINVASWRAVDDVLSRERALVRINDADYVFAGPVARPTRSGSGKAVDCAMSWATSSPTAGAWRSPVRRQRPWESRPCRCTRSTR